jgi:hypothetical protein
VEYWVKFQYSATPTLQYSDEFLNFCVNALTPLLDKEGVGEILAFLALDTYHRLEPRDDAS